MESTATQAKNSPPIFLGIVLFLISEVFLFGSLFWTYYYTRATASTWPPERPEITLAAINTVILLSSSLTIWFAGRSIRLGNVRSLALGLAATIVLAASFLVITVWEWVHESFQPWTNAYGSIFYTLTGFHALHMVIGVGLVSVIAFNAYRGRYRPDYYGPVEITGLYWHFVDIVWIYLYKPVISTGP